MATPVAVEHCFPVTPFGEAERTHRHDGPRRELHDFDLPGLHAQRFALSRRAPEEAEPAPRAVCVRRIARRKRARPIALRARALEACNGSRALRRDRHWKYIGNVAPAACVQLRAIFPRLRAESAAKQRQAVEQLHRRWVNASANARGWQTCFTSYRRQRCMKDEAAREYAK